MPTPRKLPPTPELLKLVDMSVTNAEIAEKYGVSPEAVRQALARAGFNRPRSRPDYRHYVPWSYVRSDHLRHPLRKMLAAYARRQQGWPLPATEAQKLDEFIEFCEGRGSNPTGLAMSVHYSRDDPDGFWLEPRKPGDRDYISPPLNGRDRD